ncbi:EscN/YscN/HrcN family type III secretion system ATPase [Vibrio coralliilyticus]|uniref:EscN/YscN/HrcN family type III secretion system ATPase n=1 Tax=Vibrio TaxID=662 RepID=UPI000501A05B|nr:MULTISPECIES: EscN/YscN/HrcN family type III secretion system ATPase [Vibrio]KFI10308.1 type III secretion protein ATPase [Vibrio sp. B183]NOI21239.1 EscN/YscN/HrcN family type III secretion system ATPase [Vibrio coralliilyticus]
MQLPDKTNLAEALNQQLFPDLPLAPTFRRFGKILEVTSTLIRSTLPGARQGELCMIGNDLKAEVVAIKGEEAWLSPFRSTTGIGTDMNVEPMGHGHRVMVGEELLGRVVDGLGHPMDESNWVGKWRENHGEAPDPLKRKLISKVMPTGIRAIDSTLALGVGQRVGIFAAAGGGKSTLLGMLAGHCEADVIVLALVGERGREVREFIEYCLPPAAKEKTVLVVATSDKPPLERMKAAVTATTIAEYFRDQGKNALLMVDSLTRFARAGREIGLAAGEPPVANGFPPSVFVQLASLLERAGPAPVGSITAIYTVLVEGDNMNEPVADEVRSILDGHIVLSRKLAGAGHYPAIDVNASVSRVMDQIVTAQHKDDAKHLRHLLALYQEVQLLIRVGEYQPGQDPATDEAVAKFGSIERFLCQGANEPSPFKETLQQLNQLNGG